MEMYMVKKYTTTVVGCLAFGLANVLTVMNVYSLAVKNQFGLSQTQCKSNSAFFYDEPVVKDVFLLSIHVHLVTT